MAELGFKTVEDMVGRTDMLEYQPAVNQWKSKGIDLSAILHPQKFPLATVLHQTDLQDHGLKGALDFKLIKLAKKALDEKKRVVETVKIRNIDRTVGTMLGYEITKKYGGNGLDQDTIQFTFQGSAGQSFGAFIPKGLTLTLEGDANDHVGKGLSGGKIIVYPPQVKGFIPEKNILIGNVALYGATAGEMYVNGIAGERFAVRNSGALAVVEGIGDHGCEYMTGGRVVILGKTGRNFAAGMSGGIAYVLEDGFDIDNNINPDMVELEGIDAEDEKLIHKLIKRHYLATQSPQAGKILREWKKYLPLFVKIMPKEYKRVLEIMKSEHKKHKSDDLAMMGAQISKKPAKGNIVPEAV
jgi:glutamate synthase (ferredoxin)